MSKMGLPSLMQSHIMHHNILMTRTNAIILVNIVDINQIPPIRNGNVVLVGQPTFKLDFQAITEH